MDVLSQFAHEIRGEGSPWSLCACHSTRYGGRPARGAASLLDVAVTCQLLSCQGQIWFPKRMAPVVARQLEHAGYVNVFTGNGVERFLRGQREVDAEFRWLEALDLRSIASMRKARKPRNWARWRNHSAWMDTLESVCQPRAGWDSRAASASRRVPIQGKGLPTDWEAFLVCSVGVDEDETSYDLAVVASWRRGEEDASRSDATRIRRFLRERLVGFGYRRKHPMENGSLMMLERPVSSLGEARKGRRFLDRVFQGE